MRLLPAFILALIATSTPGLAQAFCGFYVSGSSDGLYADASRVALVRDGNTTVTTMQNTYSGPLEDFALVVPVPQILQQKDVRTLPHDALDAVSS